MESYSENIKNFYIANLQELRKSKEYDSSSDFVYKICENIITNILKKRSPDKLLNMNFSRISILADCENCYDEIQIALNMLAMPKVDFIKWIYEANDIFENDGDVIEISQSEVSQALITEKYINPFNGNKITEEEYGKMIKIVFSVSDNFIKFYQSVKGEHK